jgi:hypothetical protein
MFVSMVCEDERSRRELERGEHTDLSNEVDSDALVFDFLDSLAHVDDHFATNSFIIQEDIKLLRVLLACDLDGAPALTNIEDNGGLRGAAEQPRLFEPSGAFQTISLVSTHRKSLNEC